MAQQNERLAKGLYAQYQPAVNRYGLASMVHAPDQPADTWRYQNTILFPYTLAFGPRQGIRRLYQIGVPIDDTTTWHLSFYCYVFPPEVEAPPQEYVPYAEVPLTNEQGEYYMDYVLAQDMVAWYGQGETTDRTQEHLGTTDASVIAHRRLLREQLERVLDGGEPINVFRDPAANDRMDVDLFAEMAAEMAPRGSAAPVGLYYRSNFHKQSKGGWLYIDDDADRFCPDRDTIVDLFRQSEEAWQEKHRPPNTDNAS